MICLQKKLSDFFMITTIPPVKRTSNNLMIHCSIIWSMRCKSAVHGCMNLNNLLAEKADASQAFWAYICFFTVLSCISVYFRLCIFLLNWRKTILSSIHILFVFHNSCSILRIILLLFISIYIFL